MSYILSAQRTSPEKLQANFAAYQAFLATSKDRFPHSAYELATSEWYYDVRDHRCPHDAWLEVMTLAEVSSGRRQKVRALSIRTRLLGAHHDGYIEYWYGEVHSYDLGVARSTKGNGDWLYDEIRLSDAGLVLHEIEWAAGGRWLIESTDLHYVWHPLAEPVPRVSDSSPHKIGL